MKVTRILVSLSLLALAAGTASAAPVARILWDACDAPAPLPNNRDVAPGTQAGIVASVVGQDQPVAGTNVWILLGTGTNALADAWRFDAAGCQGASLITIDHLSPALLSKTCPSLQGALTSVQVKIWDYDPSTGKGRGILGNGYVGVNTNPNPLQRYFLARFLFDHTFSVDGAGTPGLTCGDLARGVCGHVTKAEWLTATGVETPYALDNDFVTSRDAANDTRCPGATPVQAKTWGSLKAQYKQ